jgi:hypothetical protein
MLGKAAVGRVENQVVFMDASGGGANGLGAQTFEDALEGLEVADFEFDFGLVRHGNPFDFGD